MKQLFPFLICCLLLGCQASQMSVGQPGSLASSERGTAVTSAEDLMIVDCLVPGQMRKIGRKMTYLTPRRPLKTTAIDCEIRGGEYVVADLADYRSALKVWQEKAEKGDRVAQTYVGEIYEKGLGTRPDYRQAAEWYQRAAEQGYARAQINLAQLYEQGRGVTQNKLTALELYRRASGLQGGLNLEGETADQLLLEELKGLRSELERRQRELEELRRQLQSRPQPRTPQDSVPRETYQRDIAQLERHISQLQQRLSATGSRGPGGSSAQAARPVPLPPINFGRYYALIIGNNQYDNFADLTTAVNDARELARVLKNRYSFDFVKVLENATHLEILTELNTFRKNISQNDNFLLYFAGHGQFNQLNKRGFWLPKDALLDNEANWISNTTITDYLNDMSAKRVLVVADSCYSGIMAGSAVPAVSLGGSADINIAWLKTIAGKRSRTVLTSGGLEPVNDLGGGENSLFAKVLLNVLRENRELLEGQKLYVRVAPTVATATRLTEVPQEPIYAPIQFAGHEFGEFFFVPTSRVAAPWDLPLFVATPFMPQPRISPAPNVPAPL